MKKFITVVPFQVQGQLESYVYQAVGNRKLQLDSPVSFPILTAINGYVAPGEEFCVLALTPDTQDAQRNYDVLCAQLTALCRRKGLVESCPVKITVGGDERVSTHVASFQKLIDYADDGDELFACVTFGTKPLSQAVMMAVQYAYRIKNNTSVCCIVYGQVDRSAGRDKKDWCGYVYDETALVQLDEIVRKLADRKLANPKEVIDRILAL